MIIKSQNKTRDKGNVTLHQTIEKHGRPMPVSESRGFILWRMRTGKLVLVGQIMDRFDSGCRTSLLTIDPKTGASTQHWHPREDIASGPAYQMLVSRRDRVYTCFGDTFLEFDLNNGCWEFAQNHVGTAMAMAEAPDGRIYLATHPDAELLVFDPDTATLGHCGHFDSVEQYPFHLVAGDDGWVYAGLGTTRGVIAAWCVQTAQMHRICAGSNQKGASGTAQVYRGTCGTVYGRPCKEEPWYILRDGAIQPVSTSGTKALSAQTFWADAVLRTSNGSQVSQLDITTRTFCWHARDSGPVQKHFDYRSAGAWIVSVVAGADGHIYGSTAHPKRLFQYRPLSHQLNTFDNLHGDAGGNYADMTWMNGAVYAAEYPAGAIDRFVRGGTDATASERLVRGTSGMRRPRCIVAHPDRQHIVAGGFPGYGRVGGELMIHAPQEERTRYHGLGSALVGHSAVALDVTPGGDLLIGTSTEAPGGAQRTASTAALASFSWRERRVRWTIPMPLGSGEVASLRIVDARRVIVLTMDGWLVACDPEQRAIVEQVDISRWGKLPKSAGRSLLSAGSDWMLMITEDAICRLDPWTLNVCAVLRPSVSIDALGGIVARRLYFGCGSDLCSIDLSRIDEA